MDLSSLVGSTEYTLFVYFRIILLANHFFLRKYKVRGAYIFHGHSFDSPLSASFGFICTKLLLNVDSTNNLLVENRIELLVRFLPFSFNRILNDKQLDLATLQYSLVMCYSQPTTLYVESMVFVQGPSSKLGSINFITLKHSCPLLPQDQVRT